MADDPKSFTIHTSLPLPSKIAQIDGLQVLRAVAVVLVSWLHAGEILRPVATSEVPDFGTFGIDIFFVISGFIMSAILLRSAQKPGLDAAWGFLKRRLIRIFPIYWCFCLLVAIRFALNHRLFQHDYLPSLFLVSFKYPSTPLLIAFSWTLIFEMFFYGALAAILWVNTRRVVPTSIVLLCSSVLLGELVGIRRPVLIIVSNPMLLEFVSGSILALIYQNSGPRRRLGIALVLVGFTLALYLRAFPTQGGATGEQMVLTSLDVMRRVMTWGVAATMIVAGVVLWSPAIKTKLGKVAVVLGNASYSAYLASFLIIEFTVRLLLKMHGKGMLRPIEHLLYQSFAVIGVLLGGWLCYQFIEWPMVRTLQKYS